MIEALLGGEKYKGRDNPHNNDRSVKIRRGSNALSWAHGHGKTAGDGEGNELNRIDHGDKVSRSSQNRLDNLSSKYPQHEKENPIDHVQAGRLRDTLTRAARRHGQSAKIARDSRDSLDSDERNSDWFGKSTANRYTSWSNSNVRNKNIHVRNAKKLKTAHLQNKSVKDSDLE